VLRFCLQFHRSANKKKKKSETKNLSQISTQTHKFFQ
jgi:hypothetical protein